METYWQARTSATGLFCLKSDASRARNFDFVFIKTPDDDLYRIIAGG